jgi:hypothetical protein
VVPARINGQITLPFVLDTGSTDVVIPSDVLSTLIRAGTVGPRDSLGEGAYLLADGSIQPSALFLLHELRLGTRVANDVIATVGPVKAAPLLGQSFLSRMAFWALDNTRHLLILYNGNDTSTERTDTTIAEYKLFLQDGWLLSSRGALSSYGQLIFRRYGYRKETTAILNVMLFYCSSTNRKYNNMDFVIPKDYKINSFPRDHIDPQLPILILVDNTSILHFEADYKNGEIFIDRTPENSVAFDAVLGGRELAIGFGADDLLHYYLTPNMDGFLKEASATMGLGTVELGDTMFVSRLSASRLCQEFQSGKFKAR